MQERPSPLSRQSQSPPSTPPPERVPVPAPFPSPSPVEPFNPVPSRPLPLPSPLPPPSPSPSHSSRSSQQPQSPLQYQSQFNIVAGMKVPSPSPDMCMSPSPGNTRVLKADLKDRKAEPFRMKGGFLLQSTSWIFSSSCALPYSCSEVLSAVIHYWILNMMISYAIQCNAMQCSTVQYRALEQSRQHLSTQFTFSSSHHLLHSYHADIMSKMTNGNLKVQGPPPSHKGHVVAGKGKAAGIEKSSSSEKKNPQSPLRTGITPGKGEILVPGSPQVISPHPCPCPPHSICLPHFSFFSSDTIAIPTTHRHTEW